MNSFIKSLYKNHSSQIIWTAAFSQRSVDILHSASWLPSAVPFCTGKSWGSPCSQSLVCVCFLLRIQWWGVLRTRSWIHGNLFNYTASQCTRNSFKSAHCPLLFLINLMNHLNFRHFIIYHKKRSGNGKRGWIFIWEFHKGKAEWEARQQWRGRMKDREERWLVIPC